MISTFFERPLIVGASVSDDWNTKSPGKRLGLRFGPLSNITTIAQGGIQGRQLISRISDESLSDRTSVVAIDFLFWDSTDSNAAESVKALERLVALAGKRKLPLILGDIPELLPGRQSLRPELNAALRSICALNPHCLLMPLDKIHEQAVKNGLTINNRKYSIHELIPDGLHLSEPASEYLANQIASHLSH